MGPGLDVQDDPFGPISLGALGWLPYDVALGRACARAGVLVMLGAIAWGGWVLRRQHARLGADREV